MQTSKVYVFPDASGYITRIDGGYTVPGDLTGWVEIDEGSGDRYNLCQSNYLSKSIITDGGAYHYKLVDGVLVECTSEEISAQEESMKPVLSPTLESRVDKLESDAAETWEALEMILSGVTE